MCEFAFLSGIETYLAASQLLAPNRVVANALKAHCDCSVRVLEPPTAFVLAYCTRLSSSNVSVEGDGEGTAMSSAGKGIGAPANWIAIREGFASAFVLNAA